MRTGTICFIAVSAAWLSGLSGKRKVIIAIGGTGTFDETVWRSLGDEGAGGGKGKEACRNGSDHFGTEKMHGRELAD